MTEAEKREKVIWGLEACNRQSYNGSDCQNCPYYDDEDTAELPSGICNIQDMFDDALDLLKAHEPRVLTLDEVLNAEDFVWAEIWTPGDRRWCLIYARINKSIYDDILMLHEDSGFRWTRLDSNYNMNGGWRCWSARPTEEQRRNTPWEGEDDAK